MGKIIERLRLFMENRGINDNQMTVKANLPIGLIGKAKKNGTNLSADSIEKILHAYPMLSATWLMTGAGDMLTNQPTEPSHSTGVLQELLARLQSQAEEIGKLRTLIAQLEHEKPNANR